MRLVTATLALASALAAGASDVDRFAQRPGGAEVYYSSTTTVVDVAGVEHDLDSGRLMLDFAEAANDWLYLGFAIGLAFDSMPSQPLVADTDPVGYALGAFAGARFLEMGPFALTAEGRYQRIYTEGSGATQETTLKYSEGSGRFGAVFRWQKVELAAGGYTLRVDGEIETSGAPAGLADLTEVEQSGVYGGVRLAIDGGYTLGLRLESGARETLAFTFATRF
jgi:hypothetical protein